MAEPTDASSPSIRPSNSTHTVELLAAISGGAGPQSESAWTVFDRRYRPLVGAVVKRLGLSADDAEDAAQQTLLEFVRDVRTGRYDPERGRLRTWLLQIARHRAIDLVRRRRAHASEAHLAETPDRVGETGDAHLIETWESARRAAVLDEALRRLRDETNVASRTFEAFDRYAIREQPVATVADALSMSVDEVYRIKHRLANRLRDLIKEIDLTWTNDG